MRRLRSPHSNYLFGKNLRLQTDAIASLFAFNDLPGSIKKTKLLHCVIPEHAIIKSKDRKQKLLSSAISIISALVSN